MMQLSGGTGKIVGARPSVAGFAPRDERRIAVVPPVLGN
jgi:hypothetical protein